MVWYHSIKKQTTDDLLQLSVSWLKRQDFLQKNTIKNGEIYWTRLSYGGESHRIGEIKILSNFYGENSYIELNYTYKDNEHLNYRVQIISTTPNYGGKRYWFVCPQCGKKVAFIYCKKYFWCRHCHNLCYKTQQVGFADRMAIKSQKYKNRVMKNNNKKQWLHWKTFYNTMEKANYYEDLSYINVYKQICRMIKY